MALTMLRLPLVDPSHWEDLEGERQANVPFLIESSQKRTLDREEEGRVFLLETSYQKYSCLFMVRWKSSSNLDTKLKMVNDRWLQLNRKSNSEVGCVYVYI